MIAGIAGIAVIARNRRNRKGKAWRKSGDRVIARDLVIGTQASSF